MLDLSELIGPSLKELSTPQQHLLTHLSEDGEFTPHPDPTSLAPGDLVTLQLRGKVRSAVITQVTPTGIRCSSTTYHAVKTALHRRIYEMDLNPEVYANYAGTKAHHQWHSDYINEPEDRATDLFENFSSVSAAVKHAYDQEFARYVNIKQKALYTPPARVIKFTTHVAPFNQVGLHSTDKDMLHYFRHLADGLSSYARILVSNVEEKLTFVPHPDLDSITQGDVVTFTLAGSTRTAVVTKVGPKISVITVSRRHIISTTNEYFYYLNLDLEAAAQKAIDAHFSRHYYHGEIPDPTSERYRSIYDRTMEYNQLRVAEMKNAKAVCNVSFMARHLTPSQVGLYSAQ